MASAEELLRGFSGADLEGTVYCSISNDLRTIAVPLPVSVLGVESDRGFKRIHFRMERWYCGNDLSEFDLRIVYINARGEEGASPARAVTLSGDGESIVFYWDIPPAATKYAGTTKFIICAQKLAPDQSVAQEFNTTISSVSVLAGLKVDDDISPALTDEEAAILADVDVLSYMENEVASICNVDLDTRLIQLGKTAPVLGVENDKYVHIIPFRLPRYYEGVDLSGFDVRVNYANAAGMKHAGATKVISTSNNYILFVWLVDHTATATAGTVQFALRLRQSDEFGEIAYELNTLAASVSVLKGMDHEMSEDEQTAMLGQAMLGSMILGG